MFPSDIDLNDLAVASMETSTVKATIGATTLGRSPYLIGERDDSSLIQDLTVNAR